MLCVLAECSVSARKFLQGLDYYAAEGAQAFHILLGIVSQLAELGAG